VRQLGGRGKTEVNVYVMQGELSNQAAVQRTQDIYDVIEAGKCKVKVNVIDQQTANWSRDQAQNLMTNWLSTGAAFDGVIANNDEMAIGAIQAMKAAGIDMATVQVGGVDATQDALAAMQAGDLDVTVFQNAAAQGGGALDAALKLAAGRSGRPEGLCSVRTGDPGEHRRLRWRRTDPFLTARGRQRQAAPLCLAQMGRHRPGSLIASLGEEIVVAEAPHGLGGLKYDPTKRPGRRNGTCSARLSDRPDLRGAEPSCRAGVPVQHARQRGCDLQPATAGHHDPAGRHRGHHRAGRDAGHHHRRHRPVVGSVVGATAMIVMSFAQTALVNGNPNPKAIFGDWAMDLPVIVPIVVGLACGLFAGLVNGLLVAYTKIPPFIATLGMMVSARGAARWWSNGQPVSFPTEEYGQPGEWRPAGQPDLRPAAAGRGRTPPWSSWCWRSCSM
jgi:hypothetical protein